MGTIAATDHDSENIRCVCGHEQLVRLPENDGPPPAQLAAALSAYGQCSELLGKAEEERDSLIRAIDLAFFFRGGLPPLAREQCAKVVEPLIDAYESLGFKAGASLL